MNKSTERLLVIDDEPEIGNFVGEVAREIGFEVVVESTFEGFKNGCREFQPTFIVMDLAMPDADGIELLRFLNNESFKVTIVLMSGYDTKILNTAKQLGDELGLNMAGVIQKPVSIDDLEALLNIDNLVVHSKVYSGSSKSVTTAELVQALENDQLRVHFQPKVVCNGDAIKYQGEVEALVRWEHPAHGLLAPGFFMPLVEESDLLAPLTLVVATLVFQQMRLWREQGLKLSVALNVAPQLLTNLNLPDEIAVIAENNEIDCEDIIIEITETGIMEDTVLAMDILTRFRLKKFRLSMDDFGTGFSSLVSLYRMPFSELKIDLSFIRDVGHSEEARLIVRTISEMAHNLNLSVCAEGVEDQVMLDYVKSIGCDKVQGYFYSKPVPGVEIPAFFSKLNK